MRKLMVLLALAAAVPALQGCIPLIAGGAVGAALVATDRRTSGTILEDERIEVASTREINIKYLDNSHVNVTSFDRTVLLTGEVHDDQIKADVEKIVRGQPNVKNVMNELSVSGNSSITSRSSDTLITGKVKARFASENRFAPNHVKVVTESGIVYLMGMVTPQEGADAAEIASNTSGVLKVVKAFEYIDKDSAKQADTSKPAK